MVDSSFGVSGFPWEYSFLDRMIVAVLLEPNCHDQKEERERHASLPARVICRRTWSPEGQAGIVPLRSTVAPELKRAAHRGCSEVLKRSREAP